MVLDLLFILRSRHFCISSLFTIRSVGYFPSPPVLFPTRRLFFLPADSQCAQPVIFPPLRLFFLPADSQFALSRLFFLPADYFSSPPFIIPPHRLFFLPADFIQFLKTLRLCDLVPSPLLILRLHIRYLKHVCSSQQLFNKLGYDWKHIILQPNVL